MSQQIAKQKLAEYKKLIDQDIALISRRVRKQIEETYGEYSGDVFRAYDDILLRGGKRLRGALTMHAYFMGGGDDQLVAVRAATCVEMLHAYLLVLDDVADRSRLRRSGATAHVALEQYHRERNYRGDAVHFAQSQAVNAAELAQQIALSEVGRLSLPDSRKLEALLAIHDTLITTTVGQINDIMNEVMPTVAEANVRQVLTWKTAYYSFLNPLALGLLLAGKNIAQYEWLEEYALHMGICFQLTDDIIGIFGQDEQTGKSNLDDLREGKMTLLMARALTHGDEEQRTALRRILGQPDCGEPERETAMRILENTGALAYVKQLAATEGERAIFALDDAESTWGSDIPFLCGLAEYVHERSN